MTKHKKLWSLFFLSIAVVATILLAAGLSEFELLPSRPFPFGILGTSQSVEPPDESLPELPAPSLSFLGTLAIVAVAVVLVLWIIVFIIRPEARKGMLRRMITYLIWLLLIFVLISRLQRLNSADRDQANDPLGLGLSELLGPAEDLPAPPAFIIDPPHWFVVAITLTLTTLLLGAVWFLWRRRPRRRANPVEMLVQEAQQTVKKLRAGSDLKDTVMRCYFEMSRVLSEQRGVERQNAMTPREFETHLTEIGLRNEHIQQLTRLFEAVRYGANAPGQREERDAVACLTAIVEAYGRSS